MRVDRCVPSALHMCYYLDEWVWIFAHWFMHMLWHAQELGHSWIDVLKMDIEGSEWGVLEQLLLERKLLPFTQLQVRSTCRAMKSLVTGSVNP